MLKDGVYNLVGAIIRLIVVSVTIPVLLRLIGIQEFGLWTLVSAAISIATLAEAGLSISTTVFLSKDLIRNDNVATSETLTITIGLMLLLATLAALVMIYGADFIVTLFSKLTPTEQETAVASIRIGSIVVWARLMQSVLIGPIQALHRFGILNVVNTFQAVVTNSVLVIVAAKGGLTVEMTMGIALVSVGFFLIFVLVDYKLLEGRQIAIRLNRSKLNAIGRYSLLTWSSALGGQFFSQGDRLIVGSVLGTTVLGIYGAITSITVQITSLTAMALSPLLPRLSGTWSQESAGKVDVQTQLEQATVFNAFVTVGAGSLMFILAPYIVLFVIPDSNIGDVLLAFQIAILIYAIYPLNAVGYYMLFADGAVRTNLIINLLSGSLALLLIWFGAYSIGLLGAIFGNIGYVGSLAFIYFGMRYVQIPFINWVRWIRLPLLWLASVIVINLLLSEQLGLQFFAYSLQVMLFAAWFGYHQRHILYPALRRIGLSTFHGWK